MLQLFTISSLITAIAGFIIGCFVLFSDLKSVIGRIWFLTVLSISLWSFSLGMEVSSPNYETALFWNKILNIGAIFAPVLFYNFVIIFLEKFKNIKEKIIIFLGYFICLVFLVLNFFTKLFVKGVPPKAGFNYWIEGGPFYYIFFLVFIIYLSRSGYLLIKERSLVSDVKRRQISYILIAFIFGAGGGVTNFFPQIFSSNIFPFGNYLVIFYTVFITYSIVKHQLFNIKVIATEIFTLALLITLLTQTLISNNSTELLINLIIFLAVSIFGFLLIRSITKEVKQREQLEKMADDIKKAYEVEKKAKEELMRLDEAKNQFTMATQHHLRTPLTSMRGYIDLIMGGTYGKIPDRLKEPLLKFEISTKRLIKIVNEFLDISQFQLGKQVVSLRPGVKIEPIITEIIEELKFEVETKKLYLIFEKPEHAYEIKADEEKLKVALFNLIDNAVKYTQKGGVRIAIADGDKIDIRIKDTGIGIAKEEIEKLFGRTFERGKEAKKIFTTGRGIGLYITGEIVKAHNGRIWVKSDGLGMGSTFHVELPVG